VHAQGCGKAREEREPLRAKRCPPRCWGGATLLVGGSAAVGLAGPGVIEEQIATHMLATPASASLARTSDARIIECPSRCAGPAQLWLNVTVEGLCTLTVTAVVVVVTHQLTEPKLLVRLATQITCCKSSWSMAI